MSPLQTVLHRGPALAVAALTLMGASLPFAARSATVNVTPASMGGWSFNSRDSSGAVNSDPGAVGAMVTGPATPPFGTGSANLAVGNGTLGGDGAEELSTAGLDGTKLSALTALTYSTYDTLNNGQQFPYLTLAIATGNVTFPTDVLFFEPPYQTHATGNPSLPDQGATQMNTWQTWNALAGGWWDNNGVGGSGTGVVSLSAFLAAYPDATISTDPFAASLGGLGLNVGFASPTDQFNGYVDGLTIGVSGTNTTYNFDPTATPEPDTAWLLGFGVVLLMTLARRRGATIARR